MKSIKVKTPYTLVGSDFSQQEPRLLANYSQDSGMVTAYQNGKDMYSTIATQVYHNNYEDNLEHYPDGSIYEDGKQRRSVCKVVLLALMYGMSPVSMSAKINTTKEEATDIINGFYKGFPAVKKWMDGVEKFVKENGYVEDWYGRRRRLPDAQLEPYEVSYTYGRKVSSGFNPFLICNNKKCSDSLLQKYSKLCNNIRSYNDLTNLREKAKADGVTITSNSSFISSAMRKGVNACIQGGAATMTKTAMVKLFYDKELNELGFRMLIGVHDELIGECPLKNADKVAERLTTIMKTCIKDYCTVPFKCDASIGKKWYLEEYVSSLKKEMKTYKKKGDSEEVAFDKLVNSHTEQTREWLEGVIYGED